MGKNTHGVITLTDRVATSPIDHAAVPHEYTSGGAPEVNVRQCGICFAGIRFTAGEYIHTLARCGACERRTAWQVRYIGGRVLCAECAP